MIPPGRRLVVLLLCTVLVAVLLLASSLSGLQFEAGSAFPSGDGAAAAATPAATGATSAPSPLPVLEAILGVLLLVFLVYVPSRVAALLSLRNVLWLLLGLLLLGLLLSVLPRVLPGVAILPPAETAVAATPPSFDQPVSPLGSPPTGFRWLAAAGLAIGVIALALALFRPAPKPSSTAEALRDEAEKALDELRSGKDFQDVIIRSYVQMIELLQTEQHLERKKSMTPREYEDWLESEGIPAAPIQRLTALFEAVRYGDEPPDEQDEAAGVDCLMQITRYSRARRETA